MDKIYNDSPSILAAGSRLICRSTKALFQIEQCVLREDCVKADEEMRFTDFYLCETCVQRVMRCCAVQDAMERKKSELSISVISRSLSNGKEPASELWRRMLMTR